MTHINAWEHLCTLVQHYAKYDLNKTPPKVHFVIEYVGTVPYETLKEEFLAITLRDEHALLKIVERDFRVIGPNGKWVLSVRDYRREYSDCDDSDAESISSSYYDEIYARYWHFERNWFREPLPEERDNLKTVINRAEPIFDNSIIYTEALLDYDARHGIHEEERV